MESSNSATIKSNNINVEKQIIKTDAGSKNGQNKCPKCGATDISLNVNKGTLRCNYCRFEFKPEKVDELNKDISKLTGEVIGSGSQNIVENTNDVITFKCSSCGAEVVIDSSSSSQARCHWCRNTLSINQQIPNGTIPDIVLPFNITKDAAKDEIEKFVKKRRFYAHPKFKKEFTTNNVMGVYFPYMIVDINGHSFLSGQGERLVRSYTRGSNENKTTYYDADAYNIKRDFDIIIDGLTVESNSDRLDINSKDKTNNIINSIMPFDIENCVKYNANYLKGYTSEKRNTNIEDLKGIVNVQAKDIAKFSINNTLTEYNRGVAWETQNFEVKGQLWKSAYLPVWLYSYQYVNGNKKLLHYVAVNARTKETMGSVPLHYPKLVLISSFVELLGFIAMLFIDSDYSYLCLLSGIVYFFIIFYKYRNTNARHSYETETKNKVSNLKKEDIFAEHRKGLKNSSINGSNNTLIEGDLNKNKVINNIIEKNSVASFVKKKY